MTLNFSKIAKTTVKQSDEITENADDILKNINDPEDYSKLPPANEKTAREYDVKLTQGGNLAARRAGIPQATQEYNVSALRKHTADTYRLNKLIDNVVKDMDKESSVALQELIEQGHNDNFGLGTWYRPEVVNMMYIPEGTKKGYTFYRKLNDAAYVQENLNLRQELEREGYEGTTTGLIVKKVDPDIIQSKQYSNMEMRVVDGDNTRKTLNSSNISANELKKQYLDKGYSLYKISPYDIQENGMSYNFILDKDNTKYGKPMRTDILPYAPGGIREYQSGEYFVKQGMRVHGSGKDYWGVNTIVSGDDLAKVTKYTDELNRAVELWNGVEGDVAKLQKLLDNEDFKYFTNNAADVDNLIKSEKNPDGVISPEFKAGIYRDREMPTKGTEYANMPDFFTDSIFDPARVDLMKLTTKHYKKRGRLLNNVNNDLKNIASYEHVMRKLAQRISYGRNIDPLLDTQGEHYKKMFSDVAATPTGVDPNMFSGRELMLFTPVKEAKDVGNADKWKVRAANRMKNVMINLTSIPTKSDEAIINFMNNALSEIQEKLPWWDLKMLDAMKNRNPIRAVQGTTFNLLLGFGSLNQFWKQPLQVLNLLATYGADTAKALFQDLPIVLTAFAVRKDSKLLRKAVDEIAKRTGSISVEDLDILVKYFDDYGTFHQTINRAEFTNLKPTRVKTRLLLKSINSIRSLSLLPFTSGVNATNLICDVTAYRLLKDTPTFKLLTEQEKFREIAYVSDALNFNASKANASVMQKGILGGIVTNLQTYTMGTIGAIFGKSLTSVDKMTGKLGKRKIPVGFKLLAGLFFMWGAAGLTDRDYAPYMYKWLSDKTPIPKVFQEALVEGTIPLLSGMVLGKDIREGPETMSVFDSCFSIIQALTDRQSATMPDVTLSNVQPMATGTFYAMKEILTPTTNEGDVIGLLRRLHSKPLPTGPKNMVAGMYGLITRKYVDKYGNVIKDNLSDLDVSSLFFGLKPVEYRKLNTAKAIDKLYKETVDTFISDYVEPAIVDAAEYSKTINWHTAETVQYQEELEEKVKSVIAEGRKMVQDNMPDYLPYWDSRVINLFKDENKQNREVEESLSKTALKIYNESMEIYRPTPIEDRGPRQQLLYRMIIKNNQE